MTEMKNTEFQFEKNSFDGIRLFAALQIAVTHYLNLQFAFYPETRAQDLGLLAGKRLLALCPGLILLFSISGFLMGASLERSPDRKAFLKKRFLRIYPGLWVNILLAAAVVCILCRPALRECISLLRWLGIQALGVAYTPDFLKDFGAGSINGTLWTIMVELQFYLLLAVFRDKIKSLGAKGWNLLLASAVALNVLCWFLTEKGGAFAAPEAADRLLSRTFVPYAVWFVTGLYLYRFRCRLVPVLSRAVWILTPLYLGYEGYVQHFGIRVLGYYADLPASLLLPCLGIGWAYALGEHRLQNDISYGIFLYHWPVLNIFFEYGLPAGERHNLFFVLYLAATLLLGWLSWFLVERRVLRRGKNR